MEFKKLLNELKTLNLPADQYAVTASGTLAVRGIREASDLDIVVLDHLWEILSNKYHVEHGAELDKIKIGNIEFLANFKPNDAFVAISVPEQIQTADIINGVRYVQLSIVRKFKESMTRAKDLKDIKLIDAYLKNNP